ncbi:MAG: hypothetical protein LBS90_02285 [Oscillospiraceae bacterium]|jgi:hypothetical protein|nr:hypothetical protein [Oscillospiraceae bacterium]
MKKKLKSAAAVVLALAAGFILFACSGGGTGNEGGQVDIIGEEFAFSFSERPDLTVTVRNAYAKYTYGPFFMNQGVAAYTVFIDEGGSVKFSQEVTLTKVDAATYEVISGPVPADTEITISDINGYALYFSGDSGDFATFALTSDEAYSGTAATADRVLADIANNVSMRQYAGDVAFAFPELPGTTVSVTNAGAKYSYGFSQFGAGQISYTVYVGAGGTVTFSRDTTLSFVNLETYEQSTRTFAANAVNPVADISGGSLYFTDAAGDYATFVLDTDPVFGGGIGAADRDIKNIANNESLRGYVDATFAFAGYPDNTLTIKNLWFKYTYSLESTFDMTTYAQTFTGNSFYTLFIGANGTVTFSKAATLEFTTYDMTTFVPSTSTKQFDANRAYAAADVSGGKLAFPNGDYATFAAENDPFLAQGIATADRDSNKIANNAGYFVYPDGPVTIGFKEKPSLTVTVSKLNTRYAYGEFNIFGATGQFYYTIFAGDGGTVKFSEDADLIFNDAVTYAQTTKRLTANTVYPIAEISGGVLYFDGEGSDFAIFASDKDATYISMLPAANGNYSDLAK